jgi:hypothetical protein
MEQVLGRPDYDSFMHPTKSLFDEIRNKSALQENQESYYSIIKQSRESCDISVVTTNYTLYCEEISCLPKDRIAYVHGRIGLFESPKHLCTYDIERDDLGNETVFPYLFIQSGIKPIIERRQIEEYLKMIRFMDEAERIIILGYNLNNDDNHINSIIRSTVLAGKKVVYLSFDDGKMYQLQRKDVLNRLRLQDPIANLEWYAITDKDSYDAFRDKLL